MIQRIWLSALLVLPLGAMAAYSQEKKPAEAGAPKDDPMMMRMKELGTPGPSHKVLEAKVGKWAAEMKCMMTPTAAPQISKGTSEFKWILDGRFLQDQFAGQAMGEAFHGTGATGFDNAKKKYVMSWMDNMSTGIALFEGSYDAASKTFTYTGDCIDPSSGKYVKSRMVEKWTDNDHFTLQHFAPGPDGKEYLGMEIQYARAK